MYVGAVFAPPFVVRGPRLVCVYKGSVFAQEILSRGAVFSQDVLQEFSGRAVFCVPPQKKLGV